MTLLAFIKTHRENIASMWLKRALASYPADAQKFFGGEKDQFANPVGKIHRQGISTVVEWLADECDSETSIEALNDIFRVRAVQTIDPSQSIGFVFLLRDIMRKMLKADGQSLSDYTEDLAGFDARVDEIALLSFDCLMRHKKRLFEIRIGEVKRNVSQILKQTNYFDFELEAEPDRLGEKGPAGSKRGGVR